MAGAGLQFRLHPHSSSTVLNPTHESLRHSSEQGRSTVRSRTGMSAQTKTTYEVDTDTDGEDR
jgi:hypothetical protein